MTHKTQSKDNEASTQKQQEETSQMQESHVKEPAEPTMDSEDLGFEPDEDLDAPLTEEERRILEEEVGSWVTTNDPIVAPGWKPLVPLFFLVVSYLVMTFFWSDINYFFASSKAHQMESLEEGCVDSFYKRAKHNTYVSTPKAIPQPFLTTEARVEFKKRHYFVILGCELIVSMSSVRAQKLMYRFPKSSQKPASRPASRPTSKMAQALKPKPTKRSSKTRPKKKPKKRLELRPFSASGRMLRLKATSVYGPLRNFYEGNGAFTISDQFLLLVDEEKPKTSWWFLVLFGFFGLVFIFNLGSFFVSSRKYWFKRS